MKYYGIDFIDNFLFEKSVNEGLSPKTLECYNTSLNLLCLNKFIDVENFETYTEINFKRLLGEMCIKNNWSSNTYNRYRKELKCFCEYLLKNEYLKENPFQNIEKRKVKKQLPKALSIKQIKELLAKVEKTFNGNDFFNLRNKTIFYCYIYTGCRLSELINLKIEDIDFLNKTIRINEGKGGKDRIIPLTNELSDNLINFLVKKKKSRIFGNFVFSSINSIELQKRDIYKIFDKIKNGLSFTFTPHTLRHTFATELVRKDFDIYKISKLLGHENVKTTQIYLGLTVKDVSNKLETISLYS